MTGGAARPARSPRGSWIVWNGQPANVEGVLVAGQPLKLGGRLMGIEPAAVVAAAERAARRLRPAPGGSP